MDTSKQKKVNSTHTIYDKNQSKRDLFRAVIGGTDGVRLGAKTYLPQYPGELDTEYTVRLKASTIDGVVADGHQGLVGKVFHQEPDVTKVNQSIVPLFENIDNEGNHFNVFARRSFASAFDGHACIVVDAPKVDEAGVELIRVYGGEGEKMLGIRPYWRLYEAKDVINWRWSVDPVSKQTKLALLVLKECTEEPDGDFGVKEVERYRVYRDVNGVTQEVWIKTSGEMLTIIGEEFALEMPPMPMKLTAIPAAIIGDLDCEPWLLNESRLEIKAYQKESSFDVIEYLSVPVFWTKGAPEDAAFQLGPHTHLRLPDSQFAEAGYVQIDASGHTSLKASIDAIKQEIAGQLDALSQETMPQGDAQTATEVVSDDSKSQARLIVWAQQLKDALENALMFTGQFMGLGDDEGGEIVLRTAWAVAEEQMKEQRDFDRTILTEEQNIKREGIASKGK